MDPIVHFEIGAQDMNRAKDFYKKAFDWKIDSFDPQYSIATTSPVDENFMHTKPGAINGGIFKKDDGFAVKSVTVIVNVASIEEASKRVEGAGGKMIQAKKEIPEMGWSAYFQDTEGNVVGIFQAMKK